MSTPKLPKKIARADFGYYVNKFVNAPASSDDGHTNANGRAVVVAIKDYLAASYHVLAGLIAFARAYDKAPDLAAEGGPFAGVGDDFAYARLGRILRIMCGSLSKQRMFFFVLKKKVLKNEIDATWRKILERDVADATIRLDKILATAREDVAMTPFVLYLEWLDANGKTMREHLGEIVDSIDSSLAYGEYHDEIDEAVRTAIFDVMRKAVADPAILAKAKAEAETHIAAVTARKERRKAEKAELAAECLKSKREDAKEALWARLGSIEKSYQASASEETIRRIYSLYGVFYVVGTIRIFPGSYGLDAAVRYVTKRAAESDKPVTSSNVRNAAKFATEDEARAAAEKHLSLRPNDVVEVVKVDLGPIAARADVA